MGIGSSIKKAFKKIGKGIKKVVKKTVKGIKKIVKKIGSSKILKALAIAAAVVVTGGAALTAFGGGGALATSKLGSFMMGTSSKVLGGTLFGTGAKGVMGAVQGAGNFLTQAVAKPFGAVGGALGSGARVVANISQGLPALQSGPAGAGTAASAPTPFSREALTGQTKSDFLLDNVDESGATEIIHGGEGTAKVVDASTAAKGFAEKYPIATDIATGVGTSVLTGAAMHAIQGDPEYSVSPDGLLVESASDFDPLRIYAAERGIAADDMYRHFTFGNTLETGMTPLFKQETIGVV